LTSSSGVKCYVERNKIGVMIGATIGAMLVVVATGTVTTTTGVLPIFGRQH
jgi:hypothetical protein